VRRDLFKSITLTECEIDYVEITGVNSKIEEVYKEVAQDGITRRFLHPVANPGYHRYLWSRVAAPSSYTVATSPWGSLT